MYVYRKRNEHKPMFYSATLEALHTELRTIKHTSKFECYCHHIMLGRLFEADLLTYIGNWSGLVEILSRKQEISIFSQPSSISCSHTLETKDGWLDFEQEMRNLGLCCDIIPEKRHFKMQAYEDIRQDFRNSCNVLLAFRNSYWEQNHGR